MKKDNYNDNGSDVVKTLDSDNPLPSHSINKQQQQHFYQNKLLSVKNFNDAFELVKSAVDDQLKMHRAGLSLVLQVLPTQLGAYHVLGSNMIIMNKRILDIIKSKKSLLEYNAYLFMVLCHEYLHSFGIVDENQVRKMTLDLCYSLLGKEHPSSLMAQYQPWKIFPELQLYHSITIGKSYEIIKNFDRSSHSYIN